VMEFGFTKASPVWWRKAQRMKPRRRALFQLPIIGQIGFGFHQNFA
jgi:hypothetical protein